MKYLYNFNETRKDSFQCIDKAGNKYSFTLEEFLSEDIMKLNTDSKKYLIYPVIRPEWLFNKPEHIDKFCTSKREFNNKNMKLQLAGLPTKKYYLNKSWDNVAWSGRYDYCSSGESVHDSSFLTMSNTHVWLRFLAIELKGDSYTYDIGELSNAKGVNHIVFNGFRFKSFTDSFELIKNKIDKNEVVFDTDKWYLLNSVQENESSENIVFKTSLEDIFSAYYTYEDFFSSDRKCSKSLVFGTPYGMSSLSIRNLLAGKIQNP